MRGKVRHGRRRTYLASLAVFSLLYCLSPFAPSFAAYCLLKFGIGLAGSAGNVAAFTLASELVRPANRQTGKPAAPQPRNLATWQPGNLATHQPGNLAKWAYRQPCIPATRQTVGPLTCPSRSPKCPGRSPKCPGRSPKCPGQ